LKRLLVALVCAAALAAAAIFAFFALPQEPATAPESSGVFDSDGRGYYASSQASLDRAILRCKIVTGADGSVQSLTELISEGRYSNVRVYSGRLYALEDCPELTTFNGFPCRALVSFDLDGEDKTEIFMPVSEAENPVALGDFLIHDGYAYCFERTRKERELVRISLESGELERLGYQNQATYLPIEDCLVSSGDYMLFLEYYQVGGLNFMSTSSDTPKPEIHSNLVYARTDGKGVVIRTEIADILPKYTDISQYAYFITPKYAAFHQFGGITLIYRYSLENFDGFTLDGVVTDGGNPLSMLENGFVHSVYAPGDDWHYYWFDFETGRSVRLNIKATLAEPRFYPAPNGGLFYTAANGAGFVEIPEWVRPPEG